MIREENVLRGPFIGGIIMQRGINNITKASHYLL
jgi:hypothetical protein